MRSYCDEVRFDGIYLLEGADYFLIDLIFLRVFDIFQKIFGIERPGRFENGMKEEIEV